MPPAMPLGQDVRTTDLEYLQAAYSAALQLYKAEADKLCHMLWVCRDHRTTCVEQLELMAQRDREIDAHAEYYRTRKRLLHAAQLSSTNKRYYRLFSRAGAGPAA